MNVAIVNSPSVTIFSTTPYLLLAIRPGVRTILLFYIWFFCSETEKCIKIQKV